MGFWDKVKKKTNDVWSGADFWDSQENKVQRNNAATGRRDVYIPDAQFAKPQQTFFDKVRDVADANSPMDIYKRKEANQPKMYAAEQKQAGIGRIADNPWQRAVNTTKAAGEMFAESPKTLGEGFAYGFSSDVQAAEDAMQGRMTGANEQLLKTQRDLKNPNLDPTTRARKEKYYAYLQKEAGDAFKASNEFNKKKIEATDPKKMGAATADVAFTGLTAGVGTGGYIAVKEALKQGAKQGVVTAAKAGAKEMAKQSAKIASVSAPTGAFGTIARDPEASGREVAVNTAIAAGVGGAIPIAGVVAAPVAKAVGRGVVRVARGGTNATKSAAGTVSKATRPGAIKEIDDLVTQYQRAYDIETNPTRKAQISKGITDLNTTRRSINEGGYIGGRGGDPFEEQMAKARELVRQYDEVAKESDLLAERLTRENNLNKQGSQPSSSSETLARSIDNRLSDPNFDEKLGLPPTNQKPPQTRKTQSTAPDAPQEAPVQSFRDVSDTLNKAVDDAGKLYETGRFAKIKNAIKRTYDPWHVAEKIDRDYAKRIGVSYDALPAEQRLTHMLNQTANAKTISGEKLNTPTATGQSVAQVIQKYGAKTPEGRDFVNYLHMRRDLRLRSQTDGRDRLFPDYDDASLKRIVDEYEATNPGAIADRQTIVAQANADLDRGVGVLYSKEDADFVKAYYGDDFVPIERVFSESLLRPEISGRSLGSIAKQEVLQKLKPTSKLEIDNSFDSIIQRSELVEKQLSQARVAKAMVERAKAGSVDGANVIRDAAQEIVRKTMKKDIKTLINQFDSLKKEMNRAKSSERVVRVIKNNKEYNAMKAARAELKKVLQAEADKAKKTAQGLDKKIAAGRVRVTSANQKANVAQRNAVNKAKQILRNQTKDDPDAAAAISSMSARDLLEALDNNIQNGGAYMKAGAGSAQAQGAARTAKQAAQQEANLADLQNARAEISNMSVDPDVKAAINAMPDEDLLNVFRAMTDDSGKYYSNLRKSLDKTNLTHQKILSHVERLRHDMDDNIKVRREAQQTYAELRQDSATGKQYISGLENGEKFQLEVPPETARMLQGLDVRERDGIVKAAIAGQRLFQTTWTGFLNVVFPVQSFLFYDILPSVVNSRGGISAVVSRRGNQEMLRSLMRSDDYQKALRANGANVTMASGIPIDSKLTAESIAAQKSWAGRIKFNASHPKELIEALDIIGGTLSNASRTRNSWSAAAKAMKDQGIENFSREDIIKNPRAMADAVWAYNNVLPNYPRAADLAKQLNGAAPYVTASISGTRALLQGIRRNPARASAIIAGGVVAPAVAITSYNLTSPEGQEFYADMIHSGKEYILDNNLVIVTPGAKKDPKTGLWTGIIKLPVSPEFRALNRGTWQATHDAVNPDATNEFGVTTAAVSLFDTVTGGLRGSSNPVVDTARILSNQDPKSSIMNPEPLTQGEMSERPKGEQAYDTTSTAAKVVGKVTGGNVSPIQADAVLGQLGLFGRSIQNRDGNPAATVINTAKSRVSGAYGQKESGVYYEQNDKARGSLKDYEDRKAYDLEMSNDQTQGLVDAGERASLYMNRPKLFEARAKAAKETARITGKAYDPVYDLKGEDLKAYLNIQIANQFDPGSPSSKKLKKDNKNWYPEFQKRRSDFFEGLPAPEEDKKDDPNYTPLQRELLYPEPTPDVSAKLTDYSNITDSAERRAYMEANPDVTEHFNSYNQYIRNRRDALGMPQFDKYPEASSEVEAKLNAYNNLPKGEGKKGGSPARSAFLKANPDVTDHFSRIALYNLQNDAAMAIYEDEELTEKGIKSITSLARSLGMSGGGSGGSGGGYGDSGGSGGGGRTYESKNSSKTPTATKTKVTGTVAIKRNKSKPGKITVKRGGRI